jgi:peptidoglycan/LPS O-acetylase OafA/YrhL
MPTSSPSKSASNPRKYFPELDFIKAVAILLVVAFHFWGQISDWHMRVVGSDWFFAYWKNLSVSGFGDMALGLLKFKEGYFYLGVNLFVIASGFGLYFSYLKEGQVFNLKNFFSKRIWRLIPGAVLGLVIVFLVKGVFLDYWAIENWYLNLLPFLGGLNLFSDNWFFPPINGEMWFLGLVIQLYLFFPLLCKAYSKLGEKKFLILLFGISVIFRTAYYIFWKDTVSSLSYGLSLGRLFEFGFGMVLAKKSFEGKKLSLWWISGLLMFLGYFFAPSFPFTDSLLGIGFFTLLWAVAQKFSSFASLKIFKQIALQSYLMFLIHHPFIWILNKYGVNDFWNLFGILIFVGVFALSYLVAAAGNWLLQKAKV